MLLEKIDIDLKTAMRSKDAPRVRTLRSVRAAVQQKEIENRGKGDAVLSDEDVVRILQKQAKQRKDSIEQFALAGRKDLEATEAEELAIIEEYLPSQATDAEIWSVVEGIIQDAGATSMADMGKVMGKAMSALRGQADGRRINELVKKALSGDE